MLLTSSAPGAQEEPPPPPPPGGARLRRALLALALLAAAVAAAAVVLPGLVRAEIVRQALARGVELDPGTIHLALDAIRLRGARFTLVDAPGIEGALRAATIRLDGIRPTRVEAEGLTLSLVGFGAAPALATWATERRGALGELPLTVKDARTGFRDRAGAPELLAITSPSLDVRRLPAAGAAHALQIALRGARVLWTSREVARTDAAVSIDDAGISMTLGSGEPPPLRLDLRRPPAPDLAVHLAPTPVDAIAAPLGLPLRAPGVTAGGSFELRVPTAAAAAPATAAAAAPEIRAALTLDGYVPPHPRELDGILFGKTTTARATARLSSGLSALSSIALSDVELRAGALDLRGTGALKPEPSDAHLTLDLAGAVACHHLANSAVAAHLGRAAGVLAGDLTKLGLEGSVAVRIKVDARLSNIEGARVERSAQLGCRLRGLPRGLPF